MPAIIFSRILSFGEEHDVFSLGVMPKFPEKYADIRGSVKTIFILPSLVSDIKINIPGLLAENLFSYIPAAHSAAKFLRLVRGLPLSEITVETPSGEILVLSGNDGKCSSVLEKFSIISAGEISLLGEKIKTEILRSSFGKIRTLRVSSAPDFSASLLREVTLSRDGESIVGAVAYDGKGYAEYHFSKSGDFPKVLTAAIAAASSLGKEKISVKIGGDAFDFSCLDAKFKVTDRADAPLTFYAPDI